MTNQTAPESSDVLLLLSLLAVEFFPSLLSSVSSRLRSAAGSCCLQPVYSRYLWRLSLSPDLLHSFYCSESNLEFLEFPWWKQKASKTFLLKVTVQHQTQHFSSNFDKSEVISSYTLSIWCISVINTSIHPLFSISFLIFFFFNLIASLNLPSAIHSFIHHTVCVSGGTVYLSSPFPHHLIIHTVQGPKQQSCLLVKDSRGIWLSGKKAASPVR